MSGGHRSRGRREEPWPDEHSDTREYESENPSLSRARASARGDRGYWVEADDVPRRSSGRSGWSGDETEETGGARRRARSRRRRVWALGLVVLVLGVLAVLLGLAGTGRVAVPVLSEQLFPIHYQEEIARAAAEYDQDPYLVAAMIEAESGYDPEAASGASAYGLMQLRLPTALDAAKIVGKWTDATPEEMRELLRDPAVNIQLGVAYLQYLSGRYEGDARLALAAYNGGLSNLDDWLAAAGGPGSFELSDIKFPETREYVERVERYYDLYKDIHPDVFPESAG